MLIDDAQNNLAVGLRFNGIAILQGATIANAYVQFEADQPWANPTSLTIEGQAADNPPTFSGTNKIVPRPRTLADVTWAPGPWLTVGEAGFDQRTANLAAVIQEIVNRPNWTSSNSLVLVITGSGRRVAEAWDSNPAAAPLLHVEWTTGGNQPPPVSAGETRRSPCRRARTSTAPSRTTARWHRSPRPGARSAVRAPSPSGTRARSTRLPRSRRPVATRCA